MGGDDVSVFVSYARANWGEVEPIVAVLRDLGVEVWVDTNSIEPTAEWWAEIVRAIEASDATIAFLSEAFLASSVCDREMKAIHERGKKLIPVTIGDVADDDLPDWVSAIQWISANSGRESRAVADELRRAIDVDLAWSSEHARLLVRAEEWDRRGRPRSRLLRGSDVTAAEAAVLQDRPPSQPQPTSLQREYVAASRRNRGRLVTTIASVSVVVSLATSALAVVAFQQRQTAVANERRAVADALASQALAEQGARPDKAIALASAAMRLDSASNGEPVLSRLLGGVAVGDRYDRVDVAFTSAALDAAAATYALGDTDGRIRVGRLGLPVDPNPAARLDADVIGLTFADDNRLIAVLGDNRVQELTLDSGSVRITAELAVGHSTTWAYDTEHRLLAVGGSASGDDPTSGLDPEISLIRWSPGSLTLVEHTTSFTDDLPTVEALTFSANGDTLAVGQAMAVELLSLPSLRPSGPSRFVGENEPLNVEAAQYRPDGTIVVSGNPSASSRREGAITELTESGTSPRSSIILPQSIDSLAQCGDDTMYGTTGGEYGYLRDSLDSTDVVGHIEGSIDALACAPAGEFIVATNDGLVHSRRAGPTDNAVTTVARVSVEEGLQSSDLNDVGLSDDRQSLRTRDGQEIRLNRFASREVLARLPKVPGNCASLDDLALDPAVTDLPEHRSVGRCDDMTLVIDGDSAQQVEAQRDGDIAYRIDAGPRLGTYALAWSDTGARLFLGGAYEGTLYDVSDQRVPRPILTFTTPDYFTSASFLAGGDALITTHTSRQALFVDMAVHVVGGEALLQLACDTTTATVADTIAARYDNFSELRTSACPTV